MAKIDLTRQEAEALVDLIEQAPRLYPLDDLAVSLRSLFGMATKERQEEAKQERMRNSNRT